MTGPNVFRPEWDAERDDPPYRWSRSLIGRRAGAEKLGASLFELPPGAATFPLHVHHHNEELLVVLDGRPTLRTLDERRVLEPGEVVAHPAGRAGAHRIDNETDEAVRLLIVSTMLSPEINEFPDEGAFRIRDHAPGAEPLPAGLDARVRPEA
jgi:uncharacterized cupin superfamily protein